MKKLLTILLAVMMVLLSVSFSAASAEEWVCPNCGKTNTTNFCTSCGAKHDVWICPNCGAENSDAFCGNCGTARSAEAQPETPAGVESITEETSNVKAGDVITFGRYPQTTDGTGNAPIKWIVLDVQGGKALVISQYGLSSKPYNNQKGSVTWGSCSLRAWLNSEFLNTAFSMSERDAILMTEVDNGAAQGYSEWTTNGGNNTRDQVFLLSYAEVNRYCGVTREDKDNIKARVAPTAYASSTDALADRTYKTEYGDNAGWWWLRSPGRYQRNTSIVHMNGSLDERPAISTRSCVRPAMWLDLNSVSFQSENTQGGAVTQAETEPAGIKGEEIKFVPTIANALNITNWMSSGFNRALLAFSLGANAADDAVLGRADVLLAFMNNPTFVGKDVNSNNLIAASITESDMIFIYYSPTVKQAYVILLPHNQGITVGAVKLEAAMAYTCSEYYRVSESDMATCIQYIKSILN